MSKLTHKFVECMPETLEEGVIYISLQFRIISHKCCCGCGNEVVLNISPRGWQFTFDGESISISPSIGNWDFACRSHYWIRDSTVRWAERWSDKKIRRGKAEDGYFDGASWPKPTKDVQISKGIGKKSFWNKLRGK